MALQSKFCMDQVKNWLDTHHFQTSQMCSFYYVYHHTDDKQCVIIKIIMIIDYLNNVINYIMIKLT